eukprot:m.81334 g.81334  ORF g.81334 m.81334 type:complete len:556 (+) comp19456_c0_seq1:273-1940(+)
MAIAPGKTGMLRGAGQPESTWHPSLISEADGGVDDGHSLDTAHTLEAAAARLATSLDSQKGGAPNTAIMRDTSSATVAGSSSELGAAAAASAAALDLHSFPPYSPQSGRPSLESLPPIDKPTRPKTPDGALEEVSLDDSPQAAPDRSSWAGYNPVRYLFGGAAADSGAGPSTHTVANGAYGSPSHLSSILSSRGSRIPAWIIRRLSLARSDGGDIDMDASPDPDEADPMPTSAAEWADFTFEISAMLSSGTLDDRLAGCDILRTRMKGRHSDTYRKRLEDHPELIATLLTLGQRGESAISAVYTLQVMAATASDGGIKLVFDNCGATDALVASLFRTATDFGMDQADFLKLVTHTMATLLNLCIGSVPRKERCLHTPNFVHTLNELLYVDGPMACNVQVVCANLIASLAIGCADRKEILGSAGIIPHLAQLVHPGNSLPLKLQAVVTLRALMHSKQDRQLQVALQPDLMQNLIALAAVTPPEGFTDTESIREVGVALALLTRALRDAGLTVGDIVPSDGLATSKTETAAVESDAGLPHPNALKCDDDLTFEIITL